MNERVISLLLWVRDMSLTVVSAYGPNSSAKYQALLESLGRVLESAPTGDSIVLLGDFNAHLGSDSVTWRGVIGRNSLRRGKQSSTNTVYSGDGELLTLSAVEGILQGSPQSL